MTTIFSTSLSTEETVFAELCLDTSDIVLDEPHVIDIISDTHDSSDSSIRTVPITALQFEKMFYGKPQDNDSSSIGFSAAFQLIGSGRDAEDFYQLDQIHPGKYSLMNGNGDSTGEIVNLVKPITDYWVKDTGHAVDCWSTCSYMAIAKEIDTTHNLQNLDCNVCCSLCYGELLGLLDSKQPKGHSDPKRIRVEVGDKVGLRILYKNAFCGTKNVEVRIHFCIV